MRPGVRCGVVGAALLVLAAALPTAAQDAPEALEATGTGVEDFSWMAGEWSGVGPDGSRAEIDYMEPEGGVLPGLFRLVQEGRLVILEAITLVEEDDGLFMYVRHFDAALVPLERERAIRLRHVGQDGDVHHFENTNEGQNPVRSTLTRTEHGFVSRSVLARPDGSTDEIHVEYRRR